MVQRGAANLDIELDLGRYELRRAGRRIKLENKPMELLIFLVGRREQLVSRQEIASRLWRSDLFVDTEPNINNIVRKIRTALGDDPENPRFLETVIGKGYRFVGPVRVIHGQPFPELLPTSAGSPPSASTMPWARRSLAIVPLRAANPADEHVCLGIADALVSRLGNLQGVDVLPTAAVLKLAPYTAVAAAASQLGVRFLVHGEIRVSGSAPRASVEMYDAEVQRVCFARTFALDLARLTQTEEEIARLIAGTLRIPAREITFRGQPRHSRDVLAYAEFMQGFRLSSSGDPELLEAAARHLLNAVTRDPEFALAHAVLSYVFASRHFEFDPSRTWLEKAEFHCQRALSLDPNLAEAHVAKAFLLWGPSKNFQHLEALAELRRALALQKNLPHAYNRMGTILAHIGLLDPARGMYEMGRAFDPRRQVSHSIFQVYLWSGDYDLAREELEKWRAENPASKYAIYFAPQPAMLTGNFNEAQQTLNEAARIMPEEPLIVSLQGVLHAANGNSEKALACMNEACMSPKSFGHAHHTYYQISCILSLLNQLDAALEWLERSVDAGFACWPFFLRDPSLANLRSLQQFELLVSSLQAKYSEQLAT